MRSRRNRLLCESGHKVFPSSSSNQPTHSSTCISSVYSNTQRRHTNTRRRHITRAPDTIMHWGAFFSGLGPLLFSQQSIRLYCLLGLFLIIQQIQPSFAETNATSSKEASQNTSIVNNAHNFGDSHLAAASSASAKAHAKAKSHHHRSKSNLISDEDTSSTSAESIERNENHENSSSTIGRGKSKSLL